MCRTVRPRSKYLSISDPAEPWYWDWTYQAFHPIGDIHPDAEDGGPATVEAAAIYDPIMEALQWHRAARVISTPGSSADGPKSVNLAYKPDFEVLAMGSIEATPVVAKIWADQDLDFVPGPDRPGYRIDLTATMAPELIPAAIPAVILGELPVVPGATLSDVKFESARPADSFDSPDALRLLTIEYDFDLPIGSTDAAREAYSNGLDGTVFQMGRPSPMAAGKIDEARASVYTSTWDQSETWTQWVIVLDRYVGTIDVITAPDTGEVSVNVQINLEPNREVLTPR